MPLERYQQKRDFREDAGAGGRTGDAAAARRERPAAGSSSSATGPRAFTTTSASRWAVSSPAGPCPRARRSTRRSAGWPSMSRTTPRVLRFRGRDPGAPVRRRRRHRVGLGHLRTRSRRRRTRSGHRRRRAQVPDLRREAQGPLHARPDRRRRTRPHAARPRARARSGSSSTSATSTPSAGWDAEQFPASVKTGRTNDDVKAERDAVWVSRAPAAQAEIDLARRSRAADAGLHRADEGDADRPVLQRPRLAVRGQVGRLPDRGRRRSGQGANSGPATRRTARPTSRASCARRPGSTREQAIVDGEVVALDENGRPDFGLLQERISGGRRGTAGNPGGGTRRAAGLRGLRPPLPRRARSSRAFPSRTASACFARC